MTGRAGCFTLLVVFLSGPTDAAERFIRGESNGDGAVDISDPVHTLGFLFLHDPMSLACVDASDSNDDGELDISDPVHTLIVLFAGTLEMPFPGTEECGEDPTPDAFGCDEFSACPQVPASGIPVLDAVSSPTSESSILLSGTADSGVAIEVEGGRVLAQAVADERGIFSTPVDLHENRVNRLFVTAISENGRTAPRALSVIHDATAPGLHIDEPGEQAEVTAATITVAGRVSDVLSGFMGLSVTVDGVAANVVVGIGTNGTFERSGIPLELGENTITVEAVDAVGNSAARQIVVQRVEPCTDCYRMELVSGNAQEGTVYQELPEPLVVRVLRRDGSPFARKLVTFRVTRSDARLALSPGVLREDGLMTLQARADENGIASAYLRLGADAGCGNNRVSVTSADVEGGVSFCASALPGRATKINIGSGGSQRGATETPLPEPLRVWINDGCNGIEGVPVTFAVAQGGGKVNSEEFFTVRTSQTGHAEVSFVPGPESGNHVVIADFPQNLWGPARFTVFAATRDDETTTRFSGVVLDNTRNAIAGAHVTLTAGEEAFSTLTSATGQFSLPDTDFDPDVPSSIRPGFATLHVDGRTADCGGDCDYPELHYDEIVLTQGVDNSLPSPILLPKLPFANRVLYDGSKTVELTVPELDGLKMTVLAGSVTFPLSLVEEGVVPADNRTPTPERPLATPVELSLSQVHHDDIPMPMPDGAAPPFAWTFQPGGMVFDQERPVAIEYPNMSALPPGAAGYFLSFNHDTGQFDIVATGHVTEDGSKMVSDPGSGLTLSGWGCNCPPYAVTGDCCSGPEGDGQGGQLGGEQCGGCDPDDPAADDNEECTQDVCLNGRWRHLEIPDCCEGQPGPPCEDGVTEPWSRAAGPWLRVHGLGLLELPFSMEHRREVALGGFKQKCCDDADPCQSDIRRDVVLDGINDIVWGRSFRVIESVVVTGAEQLLSVDIGERFSVGLELTPEIHQGTCGEFTPGTVCFGATRDCCNELLPNPILNNTNATLVLSGKATVSFSVDGEVVSVPAIDTPNVVWSFLMEVERTGGLRGFDLTFPIDLVLTDLGLSVGDGAEPITVETDVGPVLLKSFVDGIVYDGVGLPRETLLVPPCN